MPPSPESFAAPVSVTVAYLLYWYYLLLGLQRGTKYRLQREYGARGEPFDRYFGGDREMLAADRAVINTQEQMVPFLVALWLCAVFAHPWLAGGLGLGYLALRVNYPRLLGPKIGGLQPKRVYVVTVPCYLIIVTMLVSALIGVWT
ncbi:hypothetical protein PPSIR1_03563 [Plesiocystis pacifica SIR-1]|uniref:MAPEG family protein n=1 Tax=Plesiocystis pacifica SIR-1 TaxID=391625 RepID=A6G5H2_9BACT|nr:MAPEG family protein [Plesiocystis pacifica]EDM78915.1 hypothetical protein PPSIR1_03563 [Plesiocystis pacifica SIR-1]